MARGSDRRAQYHRSSGGHQPVFNEDRSAWIVYNGEVYNFPELRPELEKRGHRFYTKTDTEVIILLTKKWARTASRNCAAVHLAIYDRTKRNRAGAGPIGQKAIALPLLKDNLYFASEIKSILRWLPNWRK